LAYASEICIGRNLVKHCAQQRLEVLRYKLAITFMGSRRNQRLDVLQPAVEELPDRDLGRFDVEATVQFRNQPRALVLRLALRAREGMPFPLPSASRRVADF
jgi:hypothetical protein